MQKAAKRFDRPNKEYAVTPELLRELASIMNYENDERPTQSSLDQASAALRAYAALLEARTPPEAGGGISSGSAPQVHDVRSYDGEHGLSPRPGHGTASDQRTTRAATDDPDLTGWTSGGIRLDRHPLISATYRLCLKAEAVPASEAATAASSAAWDLLKAIDKFLDEQAPHEPTGWRPISTLPPCNSYNDRLMVLAYGGPPDPEWVENPDEGSFTVGVEAVLLWWANHGNRKSNLTHWMPLPSAPVTKDGAP